MKLKLSGEYGLIEALTLLVERLCASGARAGNLPDAYRGDADHQGERRKESARSSGPTFGAGTESE